MRGHSALLRSRIYTPKQTGKALVTNLHEVAAIFTCFLFLSLKCCIQIHGRTHLVAFKLERFKLHGDAILSGRDHLPHAVFVGWVFFRPARCANGPI